MVSNRFLKKVRKCAERHTLPKGLDVNEFYEVYRLYSRMKIVGTWVTTENDNVAKFFAKYGFLVGKKQVSDREWIISIC